MGKEGSIGFLMHNILSPLSARTTQSNVTTKPTWLDYYYTALRIVLSLVFVVRHGINDNYVLYSGVIAG
jgi:hypothetical protein